MAALPSININIKNTIHAFEENGRLLYKYLPLQNLKVDTKINPVNPNQIDIKGLTLSSYDAKVDITKPISLDTEISYDGSVNLLVNDNTNPIKLVNSRFYLTDSTHYKIGDRKGNLDTNIYTEEDFSIEAGLVKTVRTIMDVTFLGIEDGGRLPAGSYHFYFKLADADGNETDFICESGKIVCHIGSVNQPLAIRGGLLNENSDKLIKLRLNNLDLGYDYINIYYTRSTGDDKELTTHAYKISDKFRISGVDTEVFITGYENHEEIDESEINIRYATFDSSETNENCQDITFVGNITRNYELFKTLEKYSLHIRPRLYFGENIGNLNEEYIDSFSKEDGNEYYNTKNIYYKLGLWDQDIYRYGIVYILNDYTISPVFNTRGVKELSKYTTYVDYPLEETIQYTDDYILQGTNSLFPENSKGVFKVVGLGSNDETMFNGGDSIKPIGIKFEFSMGVLDGIPSKGIDGLRQLTRGFFIVRQKRIPTLLTQALAISTAKKTYTPVIKGYFPNTATTEYFGESFLTDDSGTPKLGNSFFSIEDSLVNNNALLCPEASVRPYVYNEFFNSSEFTLKRTNYTTGKVFNNSLSNTHLFNLGNIFQDFSVKPEIDTNLLLVEPGIELINNNSTPFTSRAGNALEAWKHLDPIRGDVNDLTVFVGEEDDDSYWWKTSTKIRGDFNTFIGATTNLLEFGQVYNIFQKGYDFDNYWKSYFKIRYNDSSPFMAVSDRIPWENISNYETPGFYRGDCYISTFTHRMNWGLQDPEMPTNNKIVDPWTWYKNYRVKTTNVLVSGGLNDLVLDNTSEDLSAPTGSTYTYKKVLPMFTWKTINETAENIDVVKLVMPDSKNFEKYSEANGTFGTDSINRTDVNSIPMGHWVTFKICSNVNLALRDINFSRPSEEALFKAKRKFHPLETANPKNKLPESNVINSGISESLSNRFYFEIPDVPFIKDSFTTRIYYSNVLQETSFRNGHRIFKAQNYQDYTLEHGKLVRLIDWYGRLIAVMEHGVLMIPVNERAMVTNEMGENVYINTDTVLPKNPKELSNTFGSLWHDAIVKTPRFIYGLDTVAKKIWRTNGEVFEIISDLKIQRFLNDYIKLPSTELDKSVYENSIKVHFNAFKSDVLFVFKHGDYKFHLCWNELLNKWITRYSWFPEFSENINNIFYTFANDKIHPDKGQYLYKHGYAGNIEESGNIKPTTWYDITHPFEFEFIVVGVQGVQKIFDGMKIISNLTKPLEFYYEIVGSGYDWEPLKEGIYGKDSESEFQEYLEDNPSIVKVPYIKTTQNFTEVTKEGIRDITLERDLKTEEIYISSYQKGIDIRTSGRVKGNMEYMEDFWDIQIQPITFKYAYLNNNSIALTKQEESKIRDKFVRIRIKYDGSKYAIINAVTTFFTLSYA